MKRLIQMINLLFEIERQSAEQKHTPEQRFKFRLKYSRPIVVRIMNELEKIRLAGSEYGEMVLRTVNYILPRMMSGQEVDESFLPNHYVPIPKKQDKEAA